MFTLKAQYEGTFPFRVNYLAPLNGQLWDRMEAELAVIGGPNIKVTQISEPPQILSIFQDHGVKTASLSG